MNISNATARIGKFITLEGGEGVGKTTQLPRLEAWLKSKGLPAVSNREPGGTAIGNHIRNIVKGDKRPAGMTDREEFLYFTLSRAFYISKVVQPALAEGKWLLSDRFAASTLVYQGYAGSLSYGEVEELTRLAVDEWPDLTIILDIPPEVALARRAKDMGDGGNYFEDKPLSFHNKVREGYLRLASMYPKSYVVVDATQSADEVFTVICDVIEKSFLI